MAKSLNIVVDDGTREIPVTNKFGQLICKIHIRPGDLSILDRYNDLEKGFEEAIKPLQSIGINSDGTAKMENDWQIIKDVERDLTQRINAFFDMDEADQIFAKRSMFSSIGGEFFVEKIIAALGEIVASVMEEENKKSAKRAEKYLSDLK